MYRISYNNRLLSALVPACLIMGSGFVVILSVWQGQYNLDPHHWGLQLSNAVDISQGDVPYREIFIQYGILTTVFNYLFFSLLGGTNLSILLGVSIFYALGQIGVFTLTREYSGSVKIALFAYFSCVLLHPLAIYPWPNYVAFPFLTFGYFFVLRGEHDWKQGALGGALLGLAILVRESLLLAVLPVLIALVPIRIIFGETRIDWRAYFATISGTALPIAIFFVYLVVNDLFDYWSLVAFDLPALYAEKLMPDGPWYAIVALIEYVKPAANGSVLYKTTRMFIGLIGLAAIWVWLVAFVRIVFNRRDTSTAVLTVALAALFLFSSSVHLREVFRLATSVALGAGLVYILAARLRLSELVFIIVSVGLISSVFVHRSGNYKPRFFPNEMQINSDTRSEAPAIFRGQRWTADTFDYYFWFSDAVRALEGKSCGLSYFWNRTSDAFLTVFTTLKQTQLMPFGEAANKTDADAWSKLLRPDLDLGERLRKRDVVVFATIARDAVDTYPVPPGYVVIDRRQTPWSHYIYAIAGIWESEGLETLILAPETCTDMG